MLHHGFYHRIVLAMIISVRIQNNLFSIVLFLCVCVCVGMIFGELRMRVIQWPDQTHSTYSICYSASICLMVDVTIYWERFKPGNFVEVPNVHTH